MKTNGKWERERKRQARCGELQEQHREHTTRCSRRRKRKSCKLVRKLEQEATKLYCGWAF